MAQRILLEQLVVDRKDGAAGISEDMLDALVDQGPQHHLCADHLLCRHGRSSLLQTTAAPPQAARRDRRRTPILHTSRDLRISVQALTPAPAEGHTPTPEGANLEARRRTVNRNC